MKGYYFQRMYLVICEKCNENIIERCDELEVSTLAKAKAYAAEHQALHEADENRSRGIAMEKSAGG